jgi:Domain of unknown function (DUF6285)
MTANRPTIDPPPALELLALVAEFLGKDVAPAQADPKLRFRVLVAANLLRVASRELEGLDGFVVDRDGYAVPAELVAEAGSLRSFAEDLAAGRRSLTDPQTHRLATRYVEAKLRVAVPEALTSRSDGAPPAGRAVTD